MKSTFRLVKYFFNFPRTVLTYFFIKVFRIFPGIRVKHLLDSYVQKEKQSRRNLNQSTGHYIGNRLVVFSFCRVKLFEIKVEGDQANSLLHFYLLRKPNVFNNPFYKDLKSALDSNKGDRLILEPGCNSGKMLYHFKDRFGGRIIGADIDRPAIDVALKILKKPDEFYCVDIINSDFLSHFSENEVSLCILSSHLKHTLHYENIDIYFKTLLHISKILVIHEKYKEDIILLFRRFNIPENEYIINNDQIFGFIRSENFRI